MIGYMVTSAALGGIVGPSLGAYINSKTSDLTVVVKISLVLTALLAIYLTLLPESLKTKPAPLANIFTSQAEACQQPPVPTNTSLRQAKDSVLRNLKRALNLFKDNLISIFDPLLLFLPRNVSRSESLASSATPILIILCGFFLSFGHSGMVVSNRLSVDVDSD